MKDASNLETQGITIGEPGERLSGRGWLVTLVGEPGIGKTRTAQEMATFTGHLGDAVDASAFAGGI